MVADAIELIKKYKKQLLFVSVIIILAYGFISFFSHYSLVSVSVKNPPTTAELTVYTSSHSETKKIGKPGFHIVPRSIKSVIVEAGKNIRTESQITIPWYGYTTKEVPLKLDKNADKIAYKSSLENPCGTYSEKLNRMLQYSCFNSNSLVYYNTPEKGSWSIEKVANLFYPNYTPASYMGGLIGVGYIGGSDFAPPSNLISVSDTGEINYLNPPDGIDISKITEASIFTDKNNQANNRFVFVTADGFIYLGTPKSKTNVDYIKITPPENYNSSTQQTLCSVTGDFVTCYRGLSPNLGDSDIDFNSVKSSIFTLNFTTDATETTNVNKLLTLDDIAVTSNGMIYGKSHKKLLFFEKRNNQYHVTELSQNIDGIATGGETLTFLQDNGVFTVDINSRNLYQVFYSKNIIPNQLLAASGKIFVIGKVPGNKNTSFAWMLNNEDNLNNGNRLIDKLPSFPPSLKYGDTDFVGNVINIQVLTDRSSTPQEIRDTKQSTLDYLDSIGVDTGQLQLSSD